MARVVGLVVGLLGVGLAAACADLPLEVAASAVNNTEIVEGPGTHRDRIVQNTTWIAGEGTHVASNLVIGEWVPPGTPCPTLTIEAGARVTGLIRLGFHNPPICGNLVIRGTAEAPVIFDRVQFIVQPLGRLDAEHVVFQGCGARCVYADHPRVVPVTDHMQIAIRDSDFIGCGPCVDADEPVLLQGITFSDGSEGIRGYLAEGSRDLRFRNMTSYLVRSSANALGAVPRLTDLGGNRLPVVTTWDDYPPPTFAIVTQSQTLQDTGVEWFFPWLDVNGVDNPILTIPSSARFRSSKITIGGLTPTSSRKGGVALIGTESEPFRLTPQLNLSFAPGVSTVDLNHVVMDDCGTFERACISVTSGTLLFDDVRISRARDVGLELGSGARMDPASRGITITGSARYPIRAHSNAVAGLVSGNYSGNGTDMIQVTSGEVVTSGTWRPVGVPLLIQGAIRIGGPTAPTLTIAAGTELVMSSSLQVGNTTVPGGLRIEGTAEAPVRLHGVQPSRGAWGGIVLTPWATDNSAIENARIEDAGRLDGFSRATAAVSVMKMFPAPVVRNSLINRSAGHGILLFPGECSRLDAYLSGSGNTFSDYALRHVTCQEP
jgi:hypothetical protein